MKGFPDGLVVKNLPAMQEMQFQSLGWEDPLEQEMATHSTILAWKIPQTEELGGLQSLGSQVKPNKRMKRVPTVFAVGHCSHRVLPQNSAQQTIQMK